MSQYDPFSYGQVQVGKKPADKASSPDDMLFADAGAPRPEPKEDSSWALLKENDVDNLLPGGGVSSSVTEFGRDILGEATPQQPRAAAAAPKPVAARKPKIAAAPQPAAAVRATPPSPAEAPAPARAAAPVRAAPIMARPSLPMPRRRVTMSSVLVPASVLAAGGGGAAWFHFAQHNVVMAAITGVTALVGAALAWVILRR